MATSTATTATSAAAPAIRIQKRRVIILSLIPGIGRGTARANSDEFPFAAECPVSFYSVRASEPGRTRKERESAKRRKREPNHPRGTPRNAKNENGAGG